MSIHQGAWRNGQAAESERGKQSQHDHASVCSNQPADKSSPLHMDGAASSRSSSATTRRIVHPRSDVDGDSPHLSDLPSLSHSTSTFNTTRKLHPLPTRHSVSPGADCSDLDSPIAPPAPRQSLTAINLAMLDLASRSTPYWTMEQYMSDRSDHLAWRLSYGGEPRQSRDRAALADLRETAEETGAGRGTPPVITESQMLLHLLRRWSCTPDSGALRSEIRDLILRIFERAPWRMVMDFPGGNGHGQQEASGRFIDPSAGNSRDGTWNGAPDTGNLPKPGATPTSTTSTIRAASGLKKVKDSQLRCCFHFDPDRQCGATRGFICRLIKHLEAHGHFICGKCSQHFNGPRSKDEYDLHKQLHTLDQHFPETCIAFPCPNGDQSHHVRTPECLTTFCELSTERKWFSLFNLVLPGVTPPLWEDVRIDPDGDEQVQWRSDASFSSGDSRYDSSTAQDIGRSSITDTNSAWRDVPESFQGYGGAPQALAQEQNRGQVDEDVLMEDLQQHPFPSAQADRVTVPASAVERAAASLVSLEQAYAARLAQDVAQHAILADEQRLAQAVQVRLHDYARDLLPLINRFLFPSEGIIVADDAVVPFAAELGVRPTFAAEVPRDEPSPTRKPPAAGEMRNGVAVAVVGEDGEEDL